MKIRVELLGDLRIVRGKSVITHFRTRKTGVLLAYLAHHRDRMHPREVLIELLWPGCEEHRGRQSLSTALSSLRRQLEPPGISRGSIILADRFSVGLNPQFVTTDVSDFEATIQKAGQAQNLDEKMTLLANAVDLYRGEFLPGYYEDWILLEQHRLANLFQEAVHELISHLEERGRLDEALRYARIAVQVGLPREEDHYELMRLYTVSGQPQEALRHYHALLQTLKRRGDEEFENSLSPRIQQLVGEIRKRALGVGISAPDPLFHNLREVSLSVKPTGTITFMLAGIGNAEALRERLGRSFVPILRRYHDLRDRTFLRYRGYKVRERDNTSLVAFERVSDAIECAVELQKRISIQLEFVDDFRVRIALDTSEVRLEGEEYRGDAPRNVDEMLKASHDGQIVCSERTASLATQTLDARIRLLDLGVYRPSWSEHGERFFQVCYPDMPSRKFPPLKMEKGYVGNLPAQLTLFFGRETEMEQLERLIISDGRRLVTLTGAAGSGKTRLALETARRLSDTFHDAIWFVPLASISDPHLIADQILDSMQLERMAGLMPMDQVVEVLRHRRSLLVLDNFEHLLPKGTSVVQKLLESAGELYCLVTSRRRLNLRGEYELAIMPLPIPKGEENLEELLSLASVQLFIDRARSVRPDFQVTRRNMKALAELCAKLDGIPLALELAATWTQVFTPAQMLSRLERRFEWLSSRQRQALPHHQTLRAAIDWSYELLSPDLRRFFAQLSIFRGGWSLEAAEVICQEPMASDYLAQLRECSMITTEEQYDEIRFGMLETLREYADRKLSPEERSRLKRRHLEYFVELAETLSDGSSQFLYLNRLEAELENLREALKWGLNHSPQDALRLALALVDFWTIRNYWDEGLRASERALERCIDIPDELHTQALLRIGVLAYHCRDLDKGERNLKLSLELSKDLDDRRTICTSIYHLAIVSFMRDKREEARRLLEESLALARRLNYLRLIGACLLRLGELIAEDGDLEKAETYFRESLRLAREIGSLHGVATTLLHLGRWFINHRQAEAQPLLEEALSLFRELQDHASMSVVQTLLGQMAFERNDMKAARSYYLSSLKSAQKTIFANYAYGPIYGLARIEAAEGRLERSACLLGIASSYPGSPDVEELKASLREAMGEAEFKDAFEAGRSMNQEQVLSHCFEGS
jgi:predicted ATPase/DNA-binding SARP family transcriptional activator